MSDPSESLIKGKGSVGLAGGDAKACGPAFSENGFRADANAKANPSSILVGIQLGSEVIPFDVKRYDAGIDSIEAGEGSGVVIAIGVKDAFVAGADITEETNSGGPLGDATRIRPAFVAGLGEDLIFDFVAHLGFDAFGDVGDADGGLAGVRGDIGGGGILRGDGE